MSGLLSGIFPGLNRPAPQPQTPPVVPTIDDAAVQAKARDQIKRRAQAQGRASTYLTDPSTQMTPETDQRRMALGGF